MQVNVSFKKMDSSQALKEYTLEKFSGLKELLKNSEKVEVTFWMYDKKKVADIKVYDKGDDFFAKSHSDDFYKSINQLDSKIRAQIIKRNKKKRSYNKVA